MATLLERYAVRPHHVEAWEPLLDEQVALRTAAGFRVRRLFLETDAEPKLSCLFEHDGSDDDALQALARLEDTGAHLALRDRMAPHVFRNRVVRPVEPWVVTDATPASLAGTHGDRIAIMRRYHLVNGWNGFEHVGWDDFEAVWRRIVPVRERYGFRCLFAVADRPHDLFTWAFDHDGPWSGFADAQRDYYRDPERVELRKVFDHMADYSIHPAHQILVPEATR